MALNYTEGTIAHLSEVTTGTSNSGREWARMSVILEIPGYQGTITKLVFQVGTDRIDDVREFNVGDKVEIGWSIYAREYNGKWYNNVDLVNIKGLEVATAPAAKPAPASAPAAKAEDPDLPF